MSRSPDMAAVGHDHDGGVQAPGGAPEHPEAAPRWRRQSSGHAPAWDLPVPTGTPGQMPLLTAPQRTAATGRITRSQIAVARETGPRSLRSKGREDGVRSTFPAASQVGAPARCSWRCMLASWVAAHQRS